MLSTSLRNRKLIFDLTKTPYRKENSSKDIRAFSPKPKTPKDETAVQKARKIEEQIRKNGRNYHQL